MQVIQGTPTTGNVSVLRVPFHSNLDTPASKIYHSGSGDTLWCFSEQKRYRPSDVIKRHMIPKATIHSTFVGIWKQLSEDDQRTLIDDYGKPVSYLPEGWEDNKKLLDGFKTGDLNFTQYLIILKSIF